ncbi:MAG: hypothetical protein A2Z72_08405 [Omnitrophica bacterium RBG_13_46_9]|nr:MAG: hypothetical protein A2Z72_08405 [Omnitrophica bacterium RBG_13_46_9]
MNEKLEKTQDIFLEKISHICSEFGLNNIMAQLYAILYFSNNPLSLDDMCERLKISKGSVSVNIRMLERYGVVRRVWVKGSRRDYYAGEKDISKVIIDRLKSMAQRRISEIDNMLKAVYDEIDSVDPQNGEEKEDARAFKERVDALKNLHHKAQTLVKLFNSGLLNNFLGTGSKIKQKEEVLLSE